MHTTLTTYKFKLKTSSLQEEKLGQWLGVCRLIYNLALDIKIETYKKTGKSISRNDLQTQVKELSLEYDWIRSVHSHVRQSPLVKLDRTYKSFFRGNGFPKFAKKNKYKSFIIPSGVKIDEKYITIPKFGKIKFFKDSRKTTNLNIKQAVFKKEPNGWFVFILVEKEKILLEKSNKRIGIDIGVVNFAVMSDGGSIKNPKHLLKYKLQLRVIQRKINRSQKGSKNRNILINRFQKIHLKIKNTRTDFLHKLSTRLVYENQVIAIENLKISNMTRSVKKSPTNKNIKSKSSLNKSMLDLGVSIFGGMLDYKCKHYGRELYRVDPKFTSQTCSRCGYKDKENRKSQSVFSCLSCDLSINADHNAAINILGRAYSSVDIICNSNETENHNLFLKNKIECQDMLNSLSI